MGARKQESGEVNFTVKVASLITIGSEEEGIEVTCNEDSQNISVQLFYEMPLDREFYELPLSSLDDHIDNLQKEIDALLVLKKELNA